MRIGLRPLAVATIAMFVMLFPAAARAATILYQVTNVLNDTWQYDYFIDGISLVPGQGFAVFFDADYSDLQPLNNPAGWQVDVAEPEPPPLSSDGFYDALMTSANAYTGPFSVTFTWLGGATPPAEQPFEIYELNALGQPIPFDTGMTSAIVAAPIPEPSTALLLATGLAVSRAFTRRRNRR
jgi:hypothetical protein